MDIRFVLLPILFPMLAGVFLGICKIKNRTTLEIIVECITVITSAFSILLLFSQPEGSIQAINLAGKLEIRFRIDGLSSVFGGLVSVLWPFATLYAFSYMRHYKEKLNTFYCFYVMTFGVTLGIAFAANFMTMYMFYEMLTLVTLPLVMFPMSRKSILAGRKYVFYSIGGAAFAFIGFIFIFSFGSTMDFTFGGVLGQTAVEGKENLFRFVYVMAVLGFGVKAAIFPFHGWLPTAAIAPTPVTALLHAVAVVKAGAFAIIRITYYSFGTDLLAGSWAQYLILGFAMVTIVYGSARAWREMHFKRRLAYSTISNLSYIVFGAALMTPEGMTGSLLHMFAHAFIKITLFFTAGAILTKGGQTYITELNGIGKRMPVTMCCFTLCALGLIGIPPLSGFISKWYLCEAAMEIGTPITYIGVVVLLISALLTVMYLLTIVIKAFVPTREPSAQCMATREADWRMLVPMLLFSIVTILYGCFYHPIASWFTEIANGLW